MDNKKFNPLLLMKATKDAKNFLNNNHLDYPKGSDFSELYIRVGDSSFVSSINNQALKEVDEIPASCYLIEIAPDALKTLATDLDVDYELNAAFFKKLAKKIKGKFTINDYKEVLDMVDGSIKTNITFSNLIKLIGR